jgi:hypothetical protein
MHNLSTTLENQINLYTWSTCLQILERHGFITNERNEEMEEFSGYFLENENQFRMLPEDKLKHFLRYDD